MDLLGTGGTADPIAPLEHHDVKTRTCEVGRVHQTVVARADHDGVVAGAARPAGSRAHGRTTGAARLCGGS